MPRALYYVAQFISVLLTENLPIPIIFAGSELKFSHLAQHFQRVHLSSTDARAIDLVKGFLGQPEFRPCAPWKFAIPEFPFATFNRC